MIREVRTSARRYNNDSNRTPGATLGNGTAASGSRTFRGNEKSLRSGTVATVVSTKSAIGGRVSRIVGSDNGNTDTDNTLTGSKADDHSEKSILDVESGYGNRQSPTHVTDANGRILRTDVIAVQYHERKDNESEYEMRKLR